MKSKSLLYLTFALATGATGMLHSQDNLLRRYPEAVQASIRGHLGKGKLDEVNSIEVDGRRLYVAEIDLPGNRDLKVHLDSDGRLLKMWEDLKVSDLPVEVRKAVEGLLEKRGRIEDVDRETVGKTVRYHVEIKQSETVDLDVVLKEDGTIISKKIEEND